MDNNILAEAAAMRCVTDGLKPSKVITHSHTFSLLQINADAFAEIKQRLHGAGVLDTFYDDADGTIILPGIALTAAPASPVALRDEAHTSRSVLAEIETALLSINNGVSPQVAVGQVFAIINSERAKLNAAPAALRDDADRLSASAGSERLGSQEDKPVKNYDDFRAGMLRAAEMARNEFKRAPEAAKGHDCVYMGGYEDACDHLSVAIAQAAVIDSVRIAGPQPDWQYHISLLFSDGIEDTTLLKIFQVVEHELRAATTPPSTLAKAAAGEIVSAFPEIKEHDKWVTLGRVKIDRETETETFERATTPQLPVKDQIAAIIERCFSSGGESVKPD